eukprot:TRINITY_DN15621_c0_g1_i1.p1 TRINITY_DN15621_c0_g1~~TRINITY_DN15621_c0_g1_i1.p1  ORF type:complete len:127 (-),score=16.86 TRINITY_DN15621_c0_g1_i1:54-434(-)
MSKVALIIGLSVAFAAGILMNILSCALYGNWWPFFVIIAYVLAPIPTLLCKGNNDPFSDDTNDAQDIGFFLTGILIVSGFALPAVLTHAGLMKPAALGFAIGGGVITYITVIIFIKIVLTKEDDSF